MAVTIHHGTSFVVAGDSGDVAAGSEQGYFHLDTRFLSERTLRLDGEAPLVLQAHVPRADASWHFLTNPPLRGAPRSTLGVVVHRALGGGLRETIEIENFSGAEATLEVALSFAADFAYILSVKRSAAGVHDGWRPHVERHAGGEEAVLALRPEAGEARNRTRLRFAPPPDALDGGRAAWTLRLAPRQRWQATVEVAPSTGGAWLGASPASPERAAATRARREALGRDLPRAASDHPVIARALDQASRDLAALRIKAEGDAGEDGGGGDYAVAAGIPWYMDLFGRDSLLTSYAAVLHDPALARGTLEALARLQGRKVDRRTEEAPGKILHEYRRGELTPAARHLIPAYPYYGTIDATPLFLITLSEYVRATGDLDFARAHWGHAEAALEWMRRFGDRDGDGLLEYERDSDVGLVNQGWKDSTDSVRFRDGRIARPPIALVEVQGYAYAARRRAAELARRLGKGEDARRLDEEAAALRRLVTERFWLPERRFFAEALDGEKRRVDALTSNPGHLLWAGAVDRDHAAAIARVLLSDEMFGGFGVRTMGEREGGYNPVSYHDGSVWPHDNALLLAGLRRYGLRDEAVRLAEGLLAALGRFPDAQPPELFCGYAAARFGTPVPYPSACRPQAWASAAVVLLLRSVLGLEVDALGRRLAVAPLPLSGMTRLEVSGIPVGGGRVDVAVRVHAGEATARVTGLPEGWRRVEPATLAAGRGRDAAPPVAAGAGAQPGVPAP